MIASSSSASKNPSSASAASSFPTRAREKPQHAKVVAVGRGRVNDDGDVFALDVKVGDTVLLGKYSGSEITVAGKDYVILREEEVLGVVEGVAELAMA